MKTTNVKTRFIAPLISTIKRGLLQGMAIAIGFFGTTILAVAISGTIKTWTTGEVLKSTDLNTTISSLKTAIEGIPNWTKAFNGTDAYYTAGNVGIGTSSPTGKLHIQSDNNNRVVFTDGTTIGNIWPSSGQFNISAETSSPISFYIGGAQKLFLTASGNLGIGTGNPTQVLTVSGNAGNTTGVWVNNSDERLKKNIQPLGNYLDKLTELRPVTFEWKDPKKLNAKEGKHIGFIAQEVEKVFPYWVDTDKAGMKWLSMEGVNAAFVQSFKEVAFRLRSQELVTDLLQTEKAANDKKVIGLEEENTKLRERLSKLEDSMQKVIAAQKISRETMAAQAKK